MNDPAKRICPFCAEAIQAKAKLCPRCHQWLTWRSFRHPVISLILHVVPVTVIWVAVMVQMLLLLDRLQNPKPYYSEFPNSLKILESQMNWVDTSRGLRIYLTGVVTNTSPVAWRDAEFDCRFFDAKGVMVDAGTGHGADTTISPNDEAAFRVSLEPTAATNGYASFKISVGNARSAKSLF